MNIEFYPHDVPIQAIQDVQMALKGDHDRILQALGVPALRPIQIHIWSTSTLFLNQPGSDNIEVVEGAAGFTFDNHSHISMHLLYDGNHLGARALHEFAHIAGTAFKADFRNNPRWLWEAVALYQAGQFRPPGQLSCITLSSTPELSELNRPGSESTVIYSIGFLLAEFLVDEFGAEGLLALINENGDTQAVLGLSGMDFMRRWHHWLSLRYLQQNPVPPILSNAQISREVAGYKFFMPDGRSVDFRQDRTLYLRIGDMVQTGHWYVTGGTNVCWQILNFEAYCANFRMTNNRFFLDTPIDCNRYPLRRAKGNDRG